MQKNWNSLMIIQGLELSLVPYPLVSGVQLFLLFLTAIRSAVLRSSVGFLKHTTKEKTSPSQLPCPVSANHVYQNHPKTAQDFPLEITIQSLCRLEAEMGAPH